MMVGVFKGIDLKVDRYYGRRILIIIVDARQIIVDG
jgi:hypothetical protein